MSLRKRVNSAVAFLASVWVTLPMMVVMQLNSVLGIYHSLAVILNGVKDIGVVKGFIPRPEILRFTQNDILFNISAD
jgi:hypothetical protein